MRKVRYNILFIDEGGIRKFQGELDEGTNALCKDTDGDGAIDSNDHDPIHDLTLKLVIDSFIPLIDNSHKYDFKGLIDVPGGHNLDYESKGVKASQNLKENYAEFGTFYCNIADEKSERDYSYVEVYARNDESTKAAFTFKYYTESGIIDFGSFLYYPEQVGEETYTEIVVNDDQIDDVTVRCSLTFADRMNTYIIASSKQLNLDENEVPRYDGSDLLQSCSSDRYDLFHIIYLSYSFRTSDWANEHAILIPQDIYHESRFYNVVLPDSDLWYFDEEEVYWEVCDYTSLESPRSVVSTSSLSFIEEEEFDQFFYDLCHDENGNELGEATDLVPYKVAGDWQSHADSQWLTAAGLPPFIIDLIPEDEKFYESHNYWGEKKKTVSYLDQFCGFCSAFGEAIWEWKWVEVYENVWNDQIKPVLDGAWECWCDFAFRMPEYRYRLVHLDGETIYFQLRLTKNPLIPRVLNTPP